METASIFEDSELKKMVQKKIEVHDLSASFKGKYKKWAALYEEGYDISYIAAYDDVSRRTVVQALYALDVSSKKPTNFSSETESDLILDYYFNIEKSNTDLADEYGVHDRKPQWVTRVPALRMIIEQTEGDMSEIDAELSDDEIETIEERIEENPEKYKGRGNGEEEDWELPEEDQFKSASEVLGF